MFRPLYVTTFFSLVFLSFLHWYALQEHLYFFFPELDIFMHLFGGFALGLCAVVGARFLLKGASPKIICILVLLFVLATGALWEIFELYLNFEFNFNNFSLQDTIADLSNDLIGGCVAFYIAYKKQWYVA